MCVPTCSCVYISLTFTYQTETGVFEFRDPLLERAAGLTGADRKWMDDIVRDVNDGWDDDDPTRPPNMQYVPFPILDMSFTWLITVVL